MYNSWLIIFLNKLRWLTKMEKLNVLQIEWRILAPRAFNLLPVSENGPGIDAVRFLKSTMYKRRM